jgi:hypothetical protein
MFFLQLTLTKINANTTTTTHELVFLALHINVTSMITMNALDHLFPLIESPAQVLGANDIGL